MKNDRKRFSGVTLIVLSTIALALSCYMLCSACFNLYKAGYMEEFAAMITGTIFTGTIAFLIYVILSTWKELTYLQKAN